MQTSIFFNLYKLDPIDLPWGGDSMIAISLPQSTEDGDPIHDIVEMIMVPYNEIVKLEEDPIMSERDRRVMKLTVDTTEGIQEYKIIDFVLIGDIREWAKSQDVKLRLENYH